ncbi:polysaccharide deacetylase family protein [candidate division KSB1 bacterium]|nr:polysaccharide deacetylase family protein [candidate division KSB1 bacterium]
MHLFKKKGGAILVFHSISGKGVFSDNRISPAFFEQVIQFLKKKYRIVPLERMVKRLESGDTIPADWVVLTFDDGYKDNVQSALYILKKYDVVGTFYITLEVILGKKIFFYDHIQSLIDNAHLKEIVVDYDGKKHRFKLENQSQKDDAVLRIVLALREQRQEVQEKLINDLKCQCLAGWPVSDLSSLYLDAGDVQLLAFSGMQIGSHTLSHPNLRSLSQGELHNEIVQSKIELEAITSKTISSFSYPYGKKLTYNETVTNCIQGAGYGNAVTTQFGMVIGGSKKFELPRVGVRESQFARLKVNLLGIPI